MAGKKNAIAKQKIAEKIARKAVKASKSSSKKRTILISPIATEKCVRLIESDNMLTFLVDGTAKKPEIKKEVEEFFKVKVAKVNLLVGASGKKKAYVKLAKSHLAADVSADMGFI